MRLGNGVQFKFITCRIVRDISAQRVPAGRIVMPYRIQLPTSKHYAPENQGVD